MDFSVEPVSVLIEEGKDLFRLHYEEIASYKDAIPLNPDYDAYLRMQGRGNLHVCLARDNGVIVGYYIAIIMPHIHYKDTLCAHMDILYLHPEYRKGTMGVKLIKYAEKTCVERGARWIINGTKTVHDFGHLLERLGYRVREVMYEKFVEETPDALNA